MSVLETERTVIRRFLQDDWQDVPQLAIDWNRAPGPDFDKWPTLEADAKGLA